MIARAAALALALLVPAAARAADPCGAAVVGSVTGTVVDAVAAPVAGATVRAQGCLSGGVTTGADGSFTLPVPDGAHVIAAGKAGFVNGCWKGASLGCTAVAAGAAALAITLDALPTDDDPAHTFRTADACRQCHGAIYDQWSQSTMGITNRNRWVDNLYNGTDIQMPAGAPVDPLNPPYFGFLASHVRRNLDGTPKLVGGVPDYRTGECANCHQPEYVGTAPTGSSFNDHTRTTDHAVSCDWCHKVTDVDVSPDGIKRPNLVVGDAATFGTRAKTTMLRSTSDPTVAFGPFADAVLDDPDTMRAAVGDAIASGKVCAACHEDSADPRDIGTDDFLETYTGVPSQTTYSEWAASSFAARGIRCQDCHMPATAADHFCDTTPVTRDGSQVRDHTFPGTTPAFLESAVTLRSRATVDGDTLVVKVDVANTGAGHAFPTGVTLRHALLVVAATAKDGTALEQLPQSDGGGNRVENWGGAGTGSLADRLAAGDLAGLPGKGFARVLRDENGSSGENVLFTEAIEEFDGRIKADATDTSTYRFTLPAKWQKQDVRVETSLWYRKAFKPIALQRKWGVPGNGNAHGTDAFGRDYDANGTLVARRRNLLTCRGRLAKVKATGARAAGALTVTAALRLPKRTTLAPAVDGAVVELGGDGATAPFVDEELSGFTADGASFVYAGAAGPTRSARLTPAGKRGYKVTLALDGLDATALGAAKLPFGLESGDVCFRKTLRCKSSGDAVRCR